MKSLNGKLVLHALVIALLATPAFAKTTRYRHAHTFGYTYSPRYRNAYAPTYVPGFGNIGSNGDSISGSGMHY